MGATYIILMLPAEMSLRMMKGFHTQNPAPCKFGSNHGIASLIPSLSRRLRFQQDNSTEESASLRLIICIHCRK